MPKKVEQYKKLQKNKQGKNKYTAEYKLNNPIFTFLCCFLFCQRIVFTVGWDTC